MTLQTPVFLMNNFRQNYSLTKNFHPNSTTTSESNNIGYFSPDIDLEGGTLINVEEVLFKTFFLL